MCRIKIMSSNWKCFAKQNQVLCSYRHLGRFCQSAKRCTAYRADRTWTLYFFYWTRYPHILLLCASCSCLCWGQCRWPNSFLRCTSGWPRRVSQLFHAQASHDMSSYVKSYLSSVFILLIKKTTYQIWHMIDAHFVCD